MSFSARRLPFGFLLAVTLLLFIAIAGYYVFLEMKSSKLQAHYFSEYAKNLRYSVEKGPSSLIRFPEHGPYDERLGYVGLSNFIERLRKEGFFITEQARISPHMAQLSDWGVYSIYHEKSRAGLRITDSKDQTLFEAEFPKLLYPNFEAIPPLALNTLLFIENRKLLDETYPTLNPAVEWERFGKAALDVLSKIFGADINAAGGSTLATQLEKFRHSPGGITASVWDKLRQMTSASLRAYLDGPDTLAARRNIALNYLNSVPLSAASGYGEIQGIGEGLRIWYGADFDQTNKLLSPEAIAKSATITPEQGRAYRQFLCLILAQRRPSYYLGAGHDDLQQLANSHLRVLASAGVISTAMRDAALAATVSINRQRVPVIPTEFREHKTQSTIRARLSGSLGVKSLYELDRIDLNAKTSLDRDTQRTIAAALAGLSQKENARAAGLYGFRLLNENNNLANIVYSLTIYERTPLGNVLRIQTDNYDQPLDINEGIRLDLGSTAKLRTTVLYLQLIDEIYKKYAKQPRETLKNLNIHPRDHLTLWVVEQLQQYPNITLAEILAAALEKRYSASPGESFFTGGGLHTFANFNKDDNGKIMSVRVALQESVNLVFIRLMRDIAYHYLYQPGGVYERIEKGGDPVRREYLEKFADQEGKVYLKRFYSKYKGKKTTELLPLLTESVHPIPARLATVYRTVHPDRDPAALRRYLKNYLNTSQLSDEDINFLYDKYAIDKFNLQDRGYIARIHPLELWLVAYLQNHPDAPLKEVFDASAKERLEVYAWLFKTRHKNAMDMRIQTLLEKEAFLQIGDAWRRLGYPFADMTPSYASSIGASADRPAALAKLMGILLNDGVGYPSVKFESLHFAAHTPFETRMEMRPAKGEQLLSPEVAAAARGAAMQVVAQGTAARLKDTYKDQNGNPLPVGGKTGTGDHVRKMFGPRGREIGSQVISRTATFVFFLGDRHFGALTAYVTGPDAASYHFTSALPVQVLKSLRPVIEPMLWLNAGAVPVAAPAKVPEVVPPAPALEAPKPVRKPAAKSPPRPVFVPVPVPPMFKHLEKPGLTPPPKTAPKTVPRSGFTPAPRPVLKPAPKPTQPEGR